MKRPPKEIVFRYNGDPYTQTVVQDRTGKHRGHFAGDILNQDGKQWKVAVVRNENRFEEKGSKVIQRVFLTDNF
jgi:hypothetical protein